jgi:acetamidase/formamidase
MRFNDAQGIVRIEAIKAANQTHNVSIVDLDVIKFFGLDKPTAALAGRRGSAATSLSLSTTSAAGGVRCRITSRPGRIGVTLFALDGCVIATLPERYRSDGTLDVSLPTNRAAAAIAVVTENGTVTAVERCILLEKP